MRGLCLAGKKRPTLSNYALPDIHMGQHIGQWAVILSRSYFTGENIPSTIRDSNQSYITICDIELSEGILIYGFSTGDDSTLHQTIFDVSILSQAS